MHISCIDKRREDRFTTDIPQSISMDSRLIIISMLTLRMQSLHYNINAISSYSVHNDAVYFYLYFFFLSPSSFALCGHNMYLFEQSVDSVTKDTVRLLVYIRW